MNLAFRFPIIFWNCACLISDSGGAEMEKIEEDFTCEEEFFKKAEEKKCSQKLVHYVWDVLLRVQRNY